MQNLLEVSQKSSYGTWIEVRRESIYQNLQTIKSFQAPGTRVMALIKANAYGHGLRAVAQSLDKQVDFFGVSSLTEVLELREHKIETRLFLLPTLMPHEVEPAVAEGVTLSVSSYEEALAISEASAQSHQGTRIHIKVDTGMGRFGIPFEFALNAIEKITALKHLVLEGIFTHFPSAETEDGFTERQVQDFGLLLSALEKKGISFELRHAANSAGAMRVQSPIFNMIRPGLMLYGMYPGAALQKTIPLSPALSLKSRILSLKRLKPGQSAGYGRDFITDKPVTVGLLPVGYSHGYPWRASSRALVLWKNKMLPVAGRVSMDYLAVNFGDNNPAVGDEVTLIGEENGGKITVEDLASWAGTIPYEIVTGFAQNVPRLYL